ncbi:PIN domain-containing protein [Streptomyces tsukubensis]|uniref:PIN domain-containing protein n=1 Tax=Streptomyces tsukubensis TaxID=83656 RepID=UPI00345059F4
MRLNPGVRLDRAETVLREAVTTLSNAQNSTPYETPWQTWLPALDRVLPPLTETFADPDFAQILQSPTYWSLLQINGTGPETIRLVHRELRRQIMTLENARVQLDALAARARIPGVPVIVDTNILLRWDQPSDIDWRQILKDDGAPAAQARLIIPLVVLNELDRQKYRAVDDQLGRRAATAIRFLDRTFTDTAPGTLATLTADATIEIAPAPTPNGTEVLDPDMCILLCAADIHQLQPDAGTRVLTGDTGMRLRAREMNLPTLRLPERHRKPGTAMSSTETDETA